MKVWRFSMGRAFSALMVCLGILCCYIWITNLPNHCECKLVTGTWGCLFKIYTCPSYTCSFKRNGNIVFGVQCSRCEFTVCCVSAQEHVCDCLYLEHFVQACLQSSNLVLLCLAKGGFFKLSGVNDKVDGLQKLIASSSMLCFVSINRN